MLRSQILKFNTLKCLPHLQFRNKVTHRKILRKVGGEQKSRFDKEYIDEFKPHPTPYRSNVIYPDYKTQSAESFQPEINNNGQFSDIMEEKQIELNNRAKDIGRMMEQKYDFFNTGNSQKFKRIDIFDSLNEMENDMSVDTETQLPLGLGFDDEINKLKQGQEIDYLDYRDLLCVNKYIIDGKKDKQYSQRARADVLAFAMYKLDKKKKAHVEEAFSKKPDADQDEKYKILYENSTLEEQNELDKHIKNQYKITQAHLEIERNHLETTRKNINKSKRIVEQFKNGFTNYSVPEIQEAEKYEDGIEFEDITDEESREIIQTYNRKWKRRKQDYVTLKDRAIELLDTAENRDDFLEVKKMFDKFPESTSLEYLQETQIALLLRYIHQMKRLDKFSILYGNDPLYTVPPPYPDADEWEELENADKNDEYLGERGIFREQENLLKIQEPKDIVFDELEAENLRFDDLIKRKYFIMKWKSVLHECRNRIKIKYEEIDERRNREMKNKERTQERLEFMYQLFDWDNDRKRIRERIKKDERASIKDISKLVDEIIYYELDKSEAPIQTEDIPYTVENLTKEWKGADFSSDWDSVLKKEEAFYPNYLDNQNELKNMPDYLSSGYEDIVNRVKHNDKYADHSKINNLDRYELEVYHRLKRDPYFQHHLRNQLKYFTDGFNDNLGTLAFNINTTNLKEFPKFESLFQSKKEWVQAGKSFTQEEPTLYNGRAYGRGSRKTSHALANIRHGTGKIRVNNKPLRQYFMHDINRWVIMKPLILSELTCRVDIDLHLYGGGVMGQTQASRVAIARAVCKFDPSKAELMNQQNLIKIDTRQVEPKKIGRPKARKSKPYVRR